MMPGGFGGSALDRVGWHDRGAEGERRRAEGGERRGERGEYNEAI